MRHLDVRYKRLPSLVPWFLTSCLLLGFNSIALALAALAAPNRVDNQSFRIDVVAIEGIIHTKPEVIIRLLPRPVPGEFSRAEIEEFERWVRNLSLFDLVQVTHEGQVLRVEVQEKFTLTPILAFTSGSDLKDFTATVGVVEYNLWGTATKLGGQFNYSQRGPNIDVWLSQHPFEPNRWAKEVIGSYRVNEIRFSDTDFKWNRNRIGGEFELIGPYRYSSPLRFEVVTRFYGEFIKDENTLEPYPDGYFIGMIPEVSWDQYHWNDLMPRGYRLDLGIQLGYFFGGNQPRFEATLHYLQGIPMGDSTVLMINGVAEAVNNTKNPNHSLLIGSIAGVRGLDDNLFRNRAQAYTNLELRHAISLAPRWALQGVLFSDFGTFQSFTDEGNLLDWVGAVNLGAGIRIVPTFLANTLLRVDVAQLFSPSVKSLVQFGITQYF